MPTLDLLTSKQVADDLGLTVRQVARLVANGKLHAAHKISGQTGAYLFEPAAVAALAAERGAR